MDEKFKAYVKKENGAAGVGQEEAKNGSQCPRPCDGEGDVDRLEPHRLEMARREGT